MSAKKFKSKQIIPVIILFLIILLSIISHNFPINLEDLKYWQNKFKIFRDNNIFITIFLFFILNILINALSIPIAFAVKILSGALFGFITGLLITSFASSIGATLAFLAVRYLFGRKIDKDNNRYAKILENFNKNGLLYLLALRLSPIVPFFTINIIMGLTRIRTLYFYLITQLGALPTTILYVYAGSKLAELENLSDIISYNTVIILTLIGILPLIFKYIFSK